MRKIIKVFVSCLVVAVLSVCLLTSVGCGLLGSSDTVYTLQYTYNDQLYTINVKKGGTYNITELPEKTGYKFTGLFDAQTGGKQYVNENGYAVENYQGDSNMVLYPQFEAKEYNLILDYQGAENAGATQLKVDYDSQISNVPTNLIKEHKVFKGWYTERNCGGKLIVGVDGAVPEISIVNYENFNIGDDDSFYLYAGYETKKYQVTFNFGADYQPEVLEILYDTPISKIVPETRDNNDFAVLSWSKTSYTGQKYTGNVTGDLTLYAIEWAPCINFDTNGGDPVVALVSKAGQTVALPEPTHEIGKFVKWVDENGAKVENSITMPANSMTLTAVWQAKIAFDENGGTEVDDVSVTAGDSITLPQTTREGYIFAGWYTSDEQPYTLATMPAQGIKLKAGWYKGKTVTESVSKNGNSCYISSSSYKFEDDLTMNFSKYLSSDFDGRVTLTVEWKQSNIIAELDRKLWTGIAIYSKSVISSEYLLMKKQVTYEDGKYYSYKETLNVDLQGNKVYVATACQSNGMGIYRGYVKDMVYILTYPENTNVVFD